MTIIIIKHQLYLHLNVFVYLYGSLKFFILHFEQREKSIAFFSTYVLFFPPHFLKIKCEVGNLGKKRYLFCMQFDD